VESIGGEVSRSTAIAKVISIVMHPLFLPTVVLLLVAYAEPSSWRDFLFRTLIILFFLAVLPLAYIYLKSPRAASGAKRLQDPVAFFRKHPREICFVCLICVLPCILLLAFLDAPSPLVATLVALLATGLALALVNMFYRASYHLAAVTTLVVAVVIIWGWAVSPVFAAIPLVGWALYSLRRHSPGQLATGLGLALIISVACFYGFDLLAIGS
jgi:hypothetical protein